MKQILYFLSLLGVMLVLSVACVSCGDGDSSTLSGERFYNSTGAAYDELGASVAVAADGLTMVAGEIRGEGAIDTNQGAAYVYVNTDGTWSLAAKLTVSDGAEDDFFGSSVSISGDGSTVVVGAWLKGFPSHSSAGAVYVFEKPGGGWGNATETACLSVTGTPAGYALGVSVAISSDGSTIAAGADQYNIGSGAVYIFEKPTGSWVVASEDAVLTPSDSGTITSRFGSTVSISGDGLIVAVGSAKFEAVYVYIKPGTGWVDATVQDAKLTGSDNVPEEDKLGTSVSISSDGSTIVAGAYRPNHTGGGAVYVYNKPAGDWADATEAAKLKPSNSFDSDYFGGNVAVSSDGGKILSSMTQDTAVLLFEKPGAGWASDTKEKYMLKPGEGESGGFGNFVAMTATWYVVGAYYSEITNEHQGAFYIFDNN